MAMDALAWLAVILGALIAWLGFTPH